MLFAFAKAHTPYCVIKVTWELFSSFWVCIGAVKSILTILPPNIFLPQVLPLQRPQVCTSVRMIEYTIQNESEHKSIDYILLTVK